MRRAFLTTVLLIAAPLAHAEGTARGRALQINVENDVFTGTDNQYTSGVRAEYTGARGEVPALLAPVRDALSAVSGEDAEWSVFGGAAQTMHTPPNISVPRPGSEQRPYLGHLYGYIGLMAEQERQLDVFRLQLGVIGPPSLGEAAQKELHRRIDSPHPEGWETQLRTQPVVGLQFQRILRDGVEFDALKAPFRAEILPHLRLAAGNLETYGAAGATVRFGQNYGEDFGPITRFLEASGSGAGRGAEGFGWSVFAGVEGRAYVLPGTVEGPLLAHRRGPNAEPLVGDLFIGGSLSYGPADLNYSYVIRSKEYADEPDTNQFGAHKFGALTLRVRF